MLSLMLTLNSILNARLAYLLLTLSMYLLTAYSSQLNYIVGINAWKRLKIRFKLLSLL